MKCDLDVHHDVFALALPPSMLARAKEPDADQGDLFGADPDRPTPETGDRADG